MQRGNLSRARHARMLALIATLAIATAVGCQPPAATRSPLTSGAAGPLSRPEGAGIVARVEDNDPIGYRLHLRDGMELVLDPASSRTLVSTTNGPGSLAVYGRDDRGLWVLWLAEDPNRGAGCFALPRAGYDRGAFVAWPSNGFELPKAADFRVGSGIIVEGQDSPMAGAYTSGGLALQATFCVSESGWVTSVGP